VDYKAVGGKVMSCPPLLVTDVQLPLYALAAHVRGLGGVDRNTVVDAAVFGYQNPIGTPATAISSLGRTSRASPWGPWELALGLRADPLQSPWARDIATLIAHRIRGGIISPTGTELTCEHCQLRPACRKPWTLAGVDLDQDAVVTSGEGG
jgi:hypothetical protein